MYGLQPGKVQFSESDFRQYNPAGYKELLNSLVTARQKAEAGLSVEEKKVAQIHLESVEQLWRLSLQLAKERFEHARDIAYKEVRSAWDGLRLNHAKVRPRQELQAALEQSVAAFHRKDFTRARELSREVSRLSKVDTPALRLIPAIRSMATPAPDLDVVELLEKALEFERNNRMAQAYGMYLRVLERQPGNGGARQRLQAVRGQVGGRA